MPKYKLSDGSVLDATGYTPEDIETILKMDPKAKLIEEKADPAPKKEEEADFTPGSATGAIPLPEKGKAPMPSVFDSAGISSDSQGIPEIDTPNLDPTEEETDRADQRNRLVKEIKLTEEAIQAYVDKGNEPTKSDEKVLKGYKDKLKELDEDDFITEELSSKLYKNLKTDEKQKVGEAAKNTLISQYNEKGITDFDITPEQIEEEAQSILDRRNRPGVFESLAAQTSRGLAGFVKNTVDFANMGTYSLMELGLEMFDEDWNGTPLEKKMLYNSIKDNAGSMGTVMGLSKSIDLLQMSLEPHIRKYEEETISDELAEGNYGVAGERMIGAALESIPSIAMASLGPAGMVVLGASSAGAKFDEEFTADPSRNTGNLVANALVTGAIEAGFEVATRGVMKRAGILKNTSGSQAAEDIIRGGATGFLKNLGINNASEMASEMATKMTSIGVDALPSWTGIGLDKEIDIANQWKEVVDEGLVATVFATGSTSIGKITNSDNSIVNAAEMLLMPKPFHKRLNTLSKDFNDLSMELKNAESGVESDIIKKELISVARQISNIKASNSSALKNMTPDEIKAYANNRNTAAKLEKVLKNEKASDKRKEIATNKLEEINKVNRDLYKRSNERMFERRTKAADDLALELGFKEGPKVLNSTDEYNQAIADATGSTVESVKEKAEGSNGVFIGGGQIFVNKEVALEQRAVSVANHEVLHPVLNALIGDIDKQSAIVKGFKKRMSKKQIRVVEALMDEAGLKGKARDGEFITYFSEAILDRDIKYEQNYFQRIGNFLKSKFRKQGFENLDFESGESVFDFVKEYNNGILKNNRVDSKVVEAIRNREKETGVKVANVAQVDQMSTKKPEAPKTTSKDPKKLDASFSKKTSKDLQDELDGLDEDDFADEFEYMAAVENLEFKIEKLEEKERTQTGTSELENSKNQPKEVVPETVEEVEEAKKYKRNVRPEAKAEEVKVEEPKVQKPKVEKPKPKELTPKQTKDINEMAQMEEFLKSMKEEDFSDEFEFDAVREDVQDKLNKLRAKNPDLDNQLIKKAKAKKSSPKTAYDNEGLIAKIQDPNLKPSEKLAAEKELLASFDAMALDAIKFDTRKGDLDRTEIRDYLRGFMPGIMKSYNPKKSKFSTWVYSNIMPKAQQTYQKFQSIAHKSLDVTAGETGSVIEASGDVNNQSAYDGTGGVDTEVVGRKIKPTSLFKDPVLEKKYIDAVKAKVDSGDINLNEFTFGSLNDLAPEVTAEFFDIPVKKLQSNNNLAFRDVVVTEANIEKLTEDGYTDLYVGQNIRSESSKIQSAIKRMGRDFLKLLPPTNVAPEMATINTEAYRKVKGTGLKIPSSLMKALYKSTGARSKGVSSQVPIKALDNNISLEDYLKVFGINKKGANDYDRAIGQRLKSVAVLFGKLATNSEVRDLPGLTPIQKQNIGSGRSSFQFSKKSVLGLGGIPDAKELGSIQYSRKKRAEYEKLLATRGVKDPVAKVDALFKWAESENIPLSDRSKYKRVGLYFMANKNVNLPEDGARLDQAIKLAKSHKVDPLSFDGPAAIIERFSKGGASKVKTDLSTIPELTNKVEQPNGITIYDLPDTRGGQRVVRQLIDEHWGESAQPWCVTSTDKPEVHMETSDKKKAYDFVKNPPETDIEYEWGVTENYDHQMRGEDGLKLPRSVHSYSVTKKAVTEKRPRGKRTMSDAWQWWTKYNTGQKGWKVAFKNGNLLSLRDGGEKFSEIQHDGGLNNGTSIDDLLSQSDLDVEPRWWDRHDNASELLSVSLNKQNGLTPHAFQDSKGNYQIYAYTKGDAQGANSSFERYDDRKRLVEQKVIKKGVPYSYRTVTYGEGRHEGATFDVITKTSQKENFTKKIERQTGPSAAAYSSIKDVLTISSVRQGVDFDRDNTNIKETTIVEVTEGKSVTTNTVTQYDDTGSIPTVMHHVQMDSDGTKKVFIDRLDELKSINKGTKKLRSAYNKMKDLNNSMLPKEVRLKGDFTNQDVLDVMSKLDDLNTEIQVSFSKKKAPDLNKDFNQIIQSTSGIDYRRVMGAAKASQIGRKSGKWSVIPPSSEDFVGLLYTTLTKGKPGEIQQAWYKKHLLDPYARAMAQVSKDRMQVGKSFQQVKKDLGIIPADLKKPIPGEYFTKEHAVRVYVWNKSMVDIPGLNTTDMQTLLDIVHDDPKLLQFGDAIIKIQRNTTPPAPKKADWTAGTITTDLMEGLNDTRRKKYLEKWQANVDIIFSTENLEKLEAAYGRNYREAMENILNRMKTGRNTIAGADSDRILGRALDWVNGSTGAIMFFNTRSAVLQTISMANFIDHKENNILKASKAFLNQPQFWKDFAMLYKSDFLKERRDGLKLSVVDVDIANVAKETGFRGLVHKILKAGFTPTQMADSFAIAMGGASFYRNAVKANIKAGMSERAAEMKAMRDFRETAEESQQSSRPDKISQQQSGKVFGRTVLAFSNTQQQYSRIMKKSYLDLKNGRGNPKEHISKILYYGAVQNFTFNFLTSGLFAFMYGDADDDESLMDKKGYGIINGMVDSVLRGFGLAGTVVSATKNSAVELYKQTQKDNPDYYKATMALTQVSPVIHSKLSRFSSAWQTYKYEKDDFSKLSFSNPGILAGGKIFSAATNVPLDRLILKTQHLSRVLDEDLNGLQKTALALGWSEYSVGVTDKDKAARDAEKKKKARNKKYKKKKKNKSRGSKSRGTTRRSTYTKE